METPIHITRTERVDDIPLLLAQMDRMHLGRPYESAQIGVLLRVYDLPIRRVRIDSTTVKSYVTVTEDGLFQLGHSKEHRPDLPQLKINQLVLDPLGGSINHHYCQW